MQKECATARSCWSERFVRQLEDKESRDVFVADHVRTRVALLVRALREQEGREWTQTELGRRMDKPQSVVSRIEDPDYGKLTIETLLAVAAAFDLPLYIDMPEWEDWAALMDDMSSRALERKSFDAERLIELSKKSRDVTIVPTEIPDANVTYSEAIAPTPNGMCFNIAQSQMGISSGHYFYSFVVRPNVGMVAETTVGNNYPATIGQEKSPQLSPILWQGVA